MDDLFHKALIITDAHFGRNGNNPIANQDNLDFLTWAIDEAKTWGAETCIMLGDWFHNRNMIAVASGHAALRGLEMLSAAFQRSWFIAGNHDELYRDRRDITSIEFAKHIPNIVVVNDPLIVEDVAFWPWLMPGEHETLDLRSRYIFSHLELSGFKTNANYVMPETEQSQKADLFKQQDWVFTGHYHTRQIRKNICYVGNVMPFDHNDNDDAERGLMLLQYGKEPCFKAWPDQPLYNSLTLSEIVRDADALLRPHMTVQMAIDIPLSYEEAQEIKASLLAAYGLRKIEMINGRANVDQDVVQDDSPLHTVDQTVIEGLRGIESVELSSSRLIEIYDSLIV